MSQNRSNLQADRRNHLDLQINLLSEDENTKMLQMLQAICEHHNLAIGNDPEIRAMARKTGSAQESDRVPGSRNFPENDEFGLGSGHALGFK